MHYPEFWKLGGWTLICASLLISGRKLTEWRQPRPVPVKVAFAEAETLWETPDAANKLVVLQIPVVVEPRTRQPVSVKFRTTMPIYLIGNKEQAFRFSEQEDEPMAEGRVTIAPGVERGWIQLKADLAQLTVPEQLALEILEPEGANLGKRTNHTVRLMPKFAWDWNLVVNGEEVRHSVELPTNELPRLSSAVRINRELAEEHPVQLLVSSTEKAGSKQLTIPVGKLDVDLSSALKDMFPKTPIGRVEIRMTTKNIDGSSALNQRWLVFPTPPPPPSAKLVALTVRPLDLVDGRWSEGSGTVRLEIEGEFTEGLRAVVPVDVQLTGLAIDEEYRAAKLTVDLASDKPLAIVELNLINDEIPEPAKDIGIVARAQDISSDPLALQLRDDDPLQLQWASVPEPAVAKEGDRPAMQFQLTTSQTLPADSYSLELAATPAAPTRWAVVPMVAQFNQAAKSVTVKLFLNDDDKSHPREDIAIAAKLLGARQPSAGVRLDPLRATIIDNDDPTPNPPDPPDPPVTPRAAPLAIVIVYNDYLQQNWNAKAATLQKIGERIKAGSLADGAVHFLGADKKLVAWKGELPENLAPIQHRTYGDLLADSADAVAAIYARQKFRHAAVMWFSSDELESTEEPAFEFPAQVEPHLFWLDGGSASEWLFDHLSKPEKKRRPDSQPLLYFPANVKQSDYLDKLVEYSTK